jgi:hypothetical protein
MKTTFVTILFLTLAIWTNAKVLTVSNDSNQPAMYQSFKDAYNAANIGDTLYIVGSFTSYGNIDISKGIAIIGSGFNDPNERKLETIFGVINITYKSGDNGNIVSNGSGTLLDGIKCSSIICKIPSDLSIQIENIEIKNCELNEITLWCKANSILIHNCVVYEVIGGYSIASPSKINNLKISNNIIGKYGVNEFYSDNTSIVISNNLLFPGSGIEELQGITGATIFGNIFGCVGENVIYACKNLYFSKNLSLKQQDLNIFNQANKISGDNNIISTNPLFINVPQNKIDLTYDYRLKDTSPGKNAGPDGRNIGITSGEYAWPIDASGLLDFTGRPSLPYIEKMQILNSIIPANGILKVNVAIKSQN